MSEIDDKLDEKELQEIAPLRGINTALTLEEQESEWRQCYHLLLKESLERKKKKALENNDLAEVQRLRVQIEKIKNTKLLNQNAEEN